MENVLSKKVRQTLAGALAFVLALTSLPFTAQTVKAAAGDHPDELLVGIRTDENLQNPVTDPVDLMLHSSAVFYASASSANTFKDFSKDPHVKYVW